MMEKKGVERSDFLRKKPEVSHIWDFGLEMSVWRYFLNII